MRAHLYNRKPTLRLCHYTGEISALLRSAKNSTLLEQVSPARIIYEEMDDATMQSYNIAATHAIGSGKSPA